MSADPTDDFSFTLGHAPQNEVYTLLSERRVTEIFLDHLDLFPMSQSRKLSRHLLSLCRQYRFDPAFILALINVESGFHIKIISPSGAVGLMQIMPPTALKVAHDLGLEFGISRYHIYREDNFSLSARMLEDPFVNLSIGIAYLAWLRDHYQGLSPYYIVAAYNVGPAKMDELLSRKGFKPVITKKYYEAIRAGVPGFRFYRRKQPESQAPVRIHRHPKLAAPEIRHHTLPGRASELGI